LVVSARGYRLTELIPPEDELHASAARLLDRVLRPPAVWTTFPAGNVPLPPEYAAKLARLGLKRGWPDILILHGHLYGLELKRRGRGLSKTRIGRTRGGAQRLLLGQEDVFPLLEAAGMRIAVCHDLDEVVDALVAWGVPMLCARVAA
jgi:hypothetical protein